LIELLKDTLKDKISDVRATHRLIESPACLVVGEDELSPHLRRMLEENGGPLDRFSSNKPVLEINPQHPLVKRLMTEQNSDKLKDLAEIIFEETLLAEGGKLENPALFVKKINQLIINH
jgi:molecular chaperone HtpG